MGYRLCYIGLKCSIEEVGEYFQFELGRKVCDHGPVTASWIGRGRNTNWTIVWLEDDSFIRKNASLIETISQKTDIIACEVNEIIMWCSAQFLSNGRTKWKVTHDGNNDDPLHLQEEGQFPEAYHSIRGEHITNQRVQDDGDEYPCDHVFEIPLDLADSYLNFRHDGYIDLAEFVGILPPPKKSLAIKLLSFFGRKNN
ncbi:hypothetical protein [Labrenzia sp. PHM005]|uniref:hypothetical protein n=1 Tax=Labrenzia sp. PHM005 TaxID=2590016 RepID=UPI00113FC486|nr:hypothetical protein [Labrenzia sp. PHM005]QDG78448.1 hypothetical protein FJ695_22730 [Labrenzia sp. PHM005]